ncbi:MAG: hypothetical protein AAF366_14635 [Pseudomonadota bacterium]
MSLTLDALLARLDSLDPALPASFVGPQGKTQGAWHVTRLTMGRLSHIDCDEGLSTGGEIVIELLDGPLGSPMNVRHLARILAKGRTALAGSGPIPVQVMHRSMRHTVEDIVDGRIVLDPVHASCRPAERTSCCA